MYLCQYECYLPTYPEHMPQQNFMLSNDVGLGKIVRAKDEQDNIIKKKIFGGAIKQ